MSFAEAKPNAFCPPAGPPTSATKLGFRFGDKGTHSSRTLMLAPFTPSHRAATLG